MTVVKLLEAWQGGPAEIQLDVDEIGDDKGDPIVGLILTLHSASEHGEWIGPGQPRIIEWELGAGTARIQVPLASRATLEFTMAATLEQTRELRDALIAAVAEMERCL